MFAKNIECPNCDYKGKGKLWHSQGTVFVLDLIFLIFALLFIWTIIVPLAFAIYSLSTMRKMICPKCGYKNVVKK